jgi:uncharacterized iron-regulated membrane protein
MSTIRKAILWCHLITGTIGGLVIFVMAVTGVLLTYERQIEAWADVRSYSVVRTPEETRLSVESLLDRVQQSRSDVPSSITWPADPSAPVAVGYGRSRTVYVNPYTGQVLGEGSPRIQAFFHTVTDLHRWLGAHGENRDVARAITGACNLGFLFLVVSGFYLWWPRKWVRPQFRNVLWFRGGLSGKARDFNWHNVIGFWLFAPLFVVVLSGVVISYTWAGNLVYRLVGEEPPQPRSGPGGPGGPVTRTSTEGLDRLLTRAEREVSGWRTISVQLPPTAEAPVTFSIDRGNGGQPQERAQLVLDRMTGDVVRWEPFSSYSTGRQLRSILRFAHTGEVAGLPGQTVAGLASLGAAVLVWTGLALTWRRFRAWTARRAGRAPLRVSEAGD